MSFRTNERRRRRRKKVTVARESLIESFSSDFSLLLKSCVVEAHPRFFGIMGETFVALTNSEKLLKFLWDFTPLQLNCHIKVVLSPEVCYDDFYCYTSFFENYSKCRI